VRNLTGLFIAALMATLSASMQEARAAGVYLDASGEAGFLVSTQSSTVRGTVILTDRNDVDASLYVIALQFAPHRNLLVNVEQAYLSTSLLNAIETGFGDLRVAARTDIVHQEGRAFRLLATLRMGNGSVDLFPYSSESLDLELALGYVDSLERVHVWARAGVVSVNREKADLPVAVRHDDNVRFDAGLAIPMRSRVSLRGGSSVIAFASGPMREIYFAGLHYDYSTAFRFHATVQMEGGAPANRVSDAAVSVGLDVSF